MKILDTLEQASVRVTLVDLKAGNLSWRSISSTGSACSGAARAGYFDLGLVHVIGPAIASMNEIGAGRQIHQRRRLRDCLQSHQRKRTSSSWVPQDLQALFRARERQGVFLPAEAQRDGLRTCSISRA